MLWVPCRRASSTAAPRFLFLSNEENTLTVRRCLVAVSAAFVVLCSTLRLCPIRGTSVSDSPYLCRIRDTLEHADGLLTIAKGEKA